MNRFWLLGIVVAVFILGILGILKPHFWESRPDTQDMTAITLPFPTANETSTESVYAVVHIAGAVARPGVYRIAFGTRALDALKLAGGVLSNANLDKINMAAFVKDGQRLYIPLIKMEKQPVSKPIVQKSKSGGRPLININQATVSELMTLPGIGKVTATRIVDYREQHGRFETIESLSAVPGMHARKLEQIKFYITFY